MANTYAHTVMVARMQRELEILEKDPPPGISCWPKGDSITELEAGNKILFKKIMILLFNI